MLSKKSKIVTLIFSILSLLILKYTIDHLSEALPQVQQLIAYVSLSVIGGLVTLNSCSLLKTFTNVENSPTSNLFIWVLGEPATSFVVGFLVTAYLNSIRPPLAASVSSLPYFEWVAVALAVFVMYTMTKLSADDFYVNSRDLGWRKHIQQTTREPGRDLMHMTSVMKQFVDHGVKEPLLVCLALHLQRLGEPEEYILRTLSPLIHYQEKRSRLLAFLRTKRKRAIRNKKAREVILKILIEKINRL